MATIVKGFAYQVRLPRLAAATLIWLPLAVGAFAQDASSDAVRAGSGSVAASAAVVPQQVRYAGKMASRAGETVETEFRIYAAPEGGEALWTETQQVPVGLDGAYAVLLGGASPAGLPQRVFAGGAARWLGVSIGGGQEQERVLLSSVPYAMKSADAESLGGHTAAEFVTQAQLAAVAAQTQQTAAEVAAGKASATSAQPEFQPLANGALTGSGTSGAIPVWNGQYTEGNSNMVQVGSDIGINVVTPASTLDVGGGTTVRGTLALPATATATTAGGHNSQWLESSASTWSTTAAAAVAQNFGLEVTPVGNNTAAPTGSLALFYSAGANPLAATGFSIASNGRLTFAAGQTFPGVLLSVAGTSPITATTSAGAVTVGLNTAALETTLNAVYPTLTASNVFHSTQTINGGLTVSSTINGAYEILSGALTAQAGVVSNNLVTMRTAGVATAATNYPSPQFYFDASAYSSTLAAAQTQNFVMQEFVTGNNTATPSGYLAVEFSQGAVSPKATGLQIASNGVITFAPSQTFPITGGGTITGITTSSPLTGSGTSGSVALGLNTGALETTLNGIYPQLGAANNFAGTQTITSGDLALPLTTSANTGVITINSVPFLHDYPGDKNVFVGGAGNFTNSGDFNVSTGYQSLFSLSSGTGNSAFGDVALYANSAGSYNTGVGNAALFSNSSGTFNTAIGASSGTTGGGLTNATAVGASSTVAQSNSLVLGQTNSSKPGVDFVNVGIGTATPRSILEVAASATSQLGPVLTLTNPAGGAAAEAAIDFNTSTPSTAGSYNPGARILAVDDGSYSDDLFFFSNKPGADNNGLGLNMVIASNGQVGIGTSVPCCNGQLVVQSANGNYYGAIEALGETDANGDGVNGIYAVGADSTGSGVAGAGGYFDGGNNYENGTAGDGLISFVGTGGANYGLAGDFEGDVDVFGNFFAYEKDFKIDHPSDPANKYLVHASVESSEMMNIYTGNVMTNELGIAVVDLPQWFEVLNTDFRYQLTVIGRKAQAWISQEVQDGRFIISSDATDTKISWQITAVRQDPYAKTHPLVVEQEKNARERGFYMDPALYGQPEEKQMEWGRHPELMRKRKADREAAKNKPANSGGTTFAADQPASAVNRNTKQQPAPAVR